MRSRWKNKNTGYPIVSYNNSHKKTLFCVAVNLLNLQELKEVLREIGSKPDMETFTLKEKTMPWERAWSSFFRAGGGGKAGSAVRGAKKAPLWKGAMPARIASGYSFKHI